VANEQETSKMFGSVVANAIDFLKRSLEELEDAPKYSVIHFCAAIELFLKARLLLEHWSLVTEEPGRANMSRFQTGDFTSVGIDEAVRRLENISNLRIPKQAQRTFSQLREHRNKMMHFFHADYVGDPTKQTIESIVAEQAKAWFHLHRLISREWRNEFSDFQDQIAELHGLVDRQRGYLQAKFDALAAGIEKGKKRGIAFLPCESCGFEAAKQELIAGNLYSSYCLVCELRSNKKLREDCPNCNQPIYIYDLGEAYCEDCDDTFELAHFVDKYAPITRLGEGLVEENRAYCSDCEYSEEESVVPFNDEWLCLCCLNLHSEIDHCAWCNELVAGDLEDSYVHGCRIFCQGYLGHHSDE
jgi:hypothetical protein